MALHYIKAIDLANILGLEDHMLMVMRTHQLMDAYISDLIEEQLIEKHHLELRRIPCAVRIELAQAMGLFDPENRGLMVLLNTLRNRFAHDAQTIITEKDVRDFYNAAGHKMRSQLDELRDSFDPPLQCLTMTIGMLIATLDHALYHRRESQLQHAVALEELQEAYESARVSGSLPPSDPVFEERRRVRYEELNFGTLQN